MFKKKPIPSITEFVKDYIEKYQLATDDELITVYTAKYMRRWNTITKFKKQQSMCRIIKDMRSKNVIQEIDSDTHKDWISKTITYQLNPNQ